MVSFSAGLAFRTRFRGSALIFYLAIASLIVPSILISLGIGLLFRVLGCDPAWYSSAFGAHLTWTLPFGLLIMFAVFNRFDRRYEEAARDLGATLVADHPPRRRADPAAQPDRRRPVRLHARPTTSSPAASTPSGTFNTLPLEIYGMTTNVTTPVLYALGTVTTGVSLPGDRAWRWSRSIIAAPPPRAPRQRRRQGRLTWRAAPRVLRLPTAGPQDTAPLAAAIDRGEVDPATIVAIVGKTEGNGCVNDFTRGYATLALKLLLAERLKCAPSEIEKRVAIVMSGGTEGGLSPHLLVFCREEATAPAAAPRLAIGVGLTRAFKPEEIGRAAQIEATAEAVAAAMTDAGIASPADVHFVQIKCPLLTKERIEEAARRGATTATEDTYHSMALSRGASALGVALALGEIDGRAPRRRSARTGRSISSVASTSAGVELLRNEIVVLGNAAGWAGDLVIDHDVMKDAIDADAARRVLGRAGRRDRGRPGQGRSRALRRDPRPAPHHARRQRHPLDPPRPRPGRRRAGRRDRRHAALRLRRRRAPGPGGRRPGGDHREGLLGPRASRPARSLTDGRIHAPTKRTSS